MHSTLRFRRRRKSARRLIPICFIIVAALVVAIGASRALETRTRHTGIPLAPVKEASVTTAGTLPQPADEPADASSQVEGKWYGLCAKNLVRSVEDFRRVVQNDPILASHYADFDWSRATAEKLQKPVSVHLAYRKEDVIRYTTRRIHLPSGERYITDGNRYVRAYCCNDFLENSPLPQAKAGERAETPTAASALGPPVPLSGGGNGDASSTASPSPYAGGSPPRSTLSSDPARDGGTSKVVSVLKTPNDVPKPVAVPEPGTFLLFAGGIVGICVAEMARRRRR